jgi:hypothetical protein
MRRGLLAIALVLTACGSDTGSGDSASSSLDCDTPAIYFVDADGDGYGDYAATIEACEAPSGASETGGDCDDGDAEIHPGAEERCDAADQDCDDQIDEDPTDPSDWYADLDGDGFGDPENVQLACNAPTGHVGNDRDCDDTDANRWPGAQETCDGEDQDCDTVVDEEASDGEPWYPDLDQDGYGDENALTITCSQPEGYLEDGTDCDDDDADTWPGSVEYCGGADEDCDGTVDEISAADVRTFYEDDDGDGFGNGLSTIDSCTAPSGYADNPDDCDDTDATHNPDATEYCDGDDNDCDEEIDESGAADVTTWFPDTDGDGYGVPGTPIDACDEPSGYAATADDCDDDDETAYPGAPEDCDGVDDDCDDVIDEDSTRTFYIDTDGDGYGVPDSTVEACVTPEGYAATDDDCDDDDASIHPEAEEICDVTIDQDCDGTIDEGVDTTYYLDSDSDGYGDPASSTDACEVPSGYAENDGDCDDGDSGVNPAAAEVCDVFTDENCDGNIDEDVELTFYLDSDSDGFGDATSTTQACEVPSGYAENASDCDDGDAGINPDAVEVCDGVQDEDCDLSVDEGVTTTNFVDSDGDGYGDQNDPGSEACGVGSGYSSDNTDCDDGTASINPGQTEVCDGSVDEDCDTSIDEGVTTTSYVDADGDGYGDANDGGTETCGLAPGYSADNTDCDDDSSACGAACNTGKTEVCDTNNYDEDCDGDADDADSSVDTSTQTTYYLDDDSDSYGDASDGGTAYCDPPTNVVTNNSDCDDDPDNCGASCAPGLTEVCDSNDYDEDCNGFADDADSDVDASTQTLHYPDADGDGYGDLDDAGTLTCDAPTGYVTDNTDCDDDPGACGASCSPSETEVCDANDYDEDCDGLADDDDSGLDYTGESTYYPDVDGDTYGDSSDAGTAYCDPPASVVTDATDCNDTDPSIHPGEPEVCDAVDQDCDGDIDEGVTTQAWLDSDGDGYGDPASSIDQCTVPATYVENNEDCDDSNANISPAIAEICDGQDTDCDATTSEDGMATFINSAGTYTDITSSMNGLFGLVAQYTASTAGDVVFCDGTWTVSIEARAQITVSSQNGDRRAVILDGGGTHSVLFTNSSGVTIDVYDVTIQNGYGSEDAINIGWDTGGALACGSNGSNAYFDNVIFQDNYGGLGGAIASSCDIEITNSTFTGNSASYGGAFFLGNGARVSVDNTTIEDSYASSSAGAVYLYSYASTGSGTAGAYFDMTDSLITGSEAASGYGGAVYVDGYGGPAEISCSGSSAVTAGFDSNTALYYGGGIYLAGDYSVVDATSCDYGVPGSSDANDPASIYIVNGPEYEPGMDATFTCDGSSCGTSSSYSIGSTMYSVTVTNGSYMNVLKATTTATLDDFSTYLYSYGSCTLDMFVFEQSTDGATWDVVWSGSNSVSTGGQWVTSTDIGIVMEDGRYYAMATATDCSSSVSYYYDTTSSGDIGFGTQLGYTYSSYTSGSLSSGWNYSGHSSGITFYMLASVTEL